MVVPQWQVGAVFTRRAASAASRRSDLFSAGVSSAGLSSAGTSVAGSSPAA
ncbi:hypothetical protein ACFW2D_06105 [Streptomyces sp. NPDC058914]|uniref:hypothetical protein n=1 Tax=Streptomyces TaxID=1883 RepID=UPI003687DE2B